MLLRFKLILCFSVHGFPMSRSTVWWRRFSKRTDGGVALFMVIALPVTLVLAGIGIDYSEINATKRANQARADLAALAAAPSLPDRTEALRRVRSMITSNGGCVASAPGCKAADEPRVTFWAYNAQNQLINVTSQPNTAASVVRVDAKTDYKPVLLGAVLGKSAMQVSAPATAQRVGALPGTAIFTIRNHLLQLRTGNSLLNPLLDPLGVRIDANLLGSSGLIGLGVHLHELLGLIDGGVSLQALNFEQVLDLRIPISKIMSHTLRLPYAVGNGTYPRVGVIYPASINIPSGSVSLREVLGMSAVSPTLALATGNLLPNIRLEALELLQVVAQLKANQDQVIGLNLSTGSLLGPLLGAKVELGAIRGHKTVMTQPMAPPLPQAVLKQTELRVEAGLLGIVDFKAKLGLVGAEATLTELNCKARAGTNDVLAKFQVFPYLLSAYLELNLLAGPRKEGVTLDEEDKKVHLLTSLTPTTISFTRDDYEAADPARRINSGISAQLDLSTLGPSLKGLLSNINIGPKQQTNCGLLGLNCVISGLTAALQKIVTDLTSLLDMILPLDVIVNRVLALLGISLAEIELTLDNVNCVPENIGPARLMGNPTI